MFELFYNNTVALAVTAVVLLLAAIALGYWVIRHVDDSRHWLSWSVVGVLLLALIAFGLGFGMRAAVYAPPHHLDSLGARSIDGPYGSHEYCSRQVPRSGFLTGCFETNSCAGFLGASLLPKVSLWSGGG